MASLRVERWICLIIVSLLILMPIGCGKDDSGGGGGGGGKGVSLADTTLSGGEVGTSYSEDLSSAITGGTSPYTWLLDGDPLPAGLGLSSNGVLSGLPAADGSYDFSLRVRDDDGDFTSATFSLTIDPDPDVLFPTGVTFLEAPIDTLSVLEDGDPVESAERELLILFTEAAVRADYDAALATVEFFGGDIVGQIPPIRVAQATVANAADLQPLRDALESLPGVAWTTLNPTAEASRLPSPSSFSGDWWIGAIDAAGAWDISVGNAAVPVGVVDAGLDTTCGHFAGKSIVSVNVPGAVSDVVMHTHGTFVAGLTAAPGDDGVLATGMGWHNPLVFCDVGDRDFTSAVLNAGIVRAIDLGARVVNLSFGPAAASASALQQFRLAMTPAVRYARDHNVLIVFAAGNSAFVNDNQLLPPGAAAADILAWSQYTVRVGATAPLGGAASFSNQGSIVELAAPGESVGSAKANAVNTISVGSGTSFAAPIVTGLAALALSVDPELTAPELRQLLMDEAVPVPGMTLAAGQVDADNVLATLGGAPLSVTTTSLPNARVGNPYLRVLQAVGGTTPYTWSIASGTLPSGLTLAADGTISGTPNGSPGAKVMTFRVTDSGARTAQRQLTLTVDPATLLLTTTVLPTGQVGSGYNFQLQASGGVTPYLWSIDSGTLPTGISLSNGGLLSGNPSVTASGVIRFRVTDNVGSFATRDLLLEVVSAPAPLVVDTTSLPAGQVHFGYTAQLAASGGLAPYTWSVAVGPMPPGLTLNADGSISGTPTTTNSYNVTFEVRDAADTTANKALLIDILAAPPTVNIVTAALPGGSQSEPYSADLAAVDGVPPYTWEITAGALPAGLSLSSDGTISGTPTTAGSFNFDVRVTDAVDDTDVQPLQIDIAGQVTITTGPLSDADINVAYSAVNFAATGGTAPYTWSITDGTLPVGMNFSVAGVLDGTPSEGGTFWFRVRVDDAAAGHGSQLFSLTVISPGSLTVSGAGSDGDVSTAGVADRVLGEFTFVASADENITLQAAAFTLTTTGGGTSSHVTAVRVYLDHPSAGTPGTWDAADLKLYGPDSSWSGGASPYSMSADLAPDANVPANSLRRLFVVATLVPGLPDGATWRLSLESGSLTLTSASGSPTPTGLPADGATTTAVAPAGGPRVSGVALYHDTNRNRQPDAGDTLIVPFDTNVDVNGATVADFQLPVSGDSFGTGATVSAGPAANEVTITLGAGAKLKTRQPFNAAKLGSNAASGIDIAASPGADHIETAGGGLDAVADTPIDIGPAFVDTAQSMGTDTTAAIGVGDFDRDGDPDLFFGNATGEANRVWRNNGSGTFTNTGQSLDSRDTRSVAVGDVDNDGDLDVVTGNFNTGNRVWVNDGIGNFAHNGQDLGTSDTTCVLLADLNHDGGLDLIEGNSGAQGTRIFFNPGTGTFTDAGVSYGNSDTRDIAVADVDRDGDLDLIVGNGSGQANRIWLNNGSGVFTDSGQTLGTGDTRCIAVGDIDYDGDIDFVEGNGTQGGRLWLNDGTGTFSAGQATEAGWTDVALVDYDCDGDLDILAVRSGAGNRVWLNDGAGNFSNSWQNLGTGNTQALAVVDADRDGAPDMVTGNQSGQGNRVWHNSLAGTWGTIGFTDSGNVFAQLYSRCVRSGDVDGDGDIDLVIGHGTSQANQILLNDGVGNFSDSGVVFDGDLFSMDIRLVDLDRDGDLDMIFVFDEQVNEVWFKDDGLMSYTLAGFHFGADVNQGSAPFGDIDHDGDIDVVLGHTGGWRVWFNDGDGSSFTQGSLGPGAAYRRGELVDIDSDGDLDVVGGNIGSASTWCVKRTPGQGIGGWTLGNQIINLVHLGNVAAGDVDRDGDVDIVFGCYGDGGAGSANKVWRNNGSAFFTDSGQSLGSAYTRDVRLADIDGDGDLDMICGNYQGSGNRIWLNDGAGNFSDSGLSIGTGNTLAIALADVDHDGDLDLVEANGPDERDKIWLNE